MKRILSTIFLLFTILSCFAQENEMAAALARLKSLRGTDQFLQVKDSLYKVASRTNDFEVMGVIHMSNIRHYTSIGSLSVKDDLKRAVHDCKHFCRTHDDFMNTYYAAWNAYITYLVNNSIFSEASLEINNMQNEAIADKHPSGIFTSYVSQGNFNSLQGLIELGAESYEKAIQYYNENSAEITGSLIAAVYSNLAGCYIALEEYDKAEEILVNAISSTSQENHVGNYTVNLGLLYEKKGEWDRMYEVISSMDPDKAFSSASRNKVFGLQARYWLHERDYGKALESANRMEAPESYETLAKIYLAKGDYRNAYTFKNLSDSVTIAAKTKLQQTQMEETDRLFDHKRIFEEEVARRQKHNASVIAALLLILVTGLVLVTLNARRRKRIDRILREEHEKTVRANQMKTIFISNMSHEIRTPLNHISGFSRLLDDKETASNPDTVLEYAGIIHKQSDHLTHIMDNITEVSEKLASLDSLSTEETVLREYDLHK